MVICSMYIIWKKTAALSPAFRLWPIPRRRGRDSTPPPPGQLPPFCATAASRAPPRIPRRRRIRSTSPIRAPRPRPGHLPTLPRRRDRRDTSLHPRATAALAGKPPSTPAAAAAIGHPPSVLAPSPQGISLHSRLVPTISSMKTVYAS
jgi:hypothetical protein